MMEYSMRSKYIDGMDNRYIMPGTIHQNSCGWRQAAMKNELDKDIRKIAEGEPMPSSPSCKAVPTITAIMIIAYAVERIWAHRS
jgi:hypothetical protein